MGNNSTIGGGGFHHVAIRSHDFDASVEFYTKVMGFTEKIAWGEGDGRVTMLDTGDGNYLEIFANGKPGEKPEGSVIHLALRTTDVDAVIERARSAGQKSRSNQRTSRSRADRSPPPSGSLFSRAPTGRSSNSFTTKRHRQP